MKCLNYKFWLLQSKVSTDKTINVSEVCRRLCISRTHFYHIVNGRGGKARTVTAVIEALGFNVKDTMIAEEPVERKSLEPV